MTVTNTSNCLFNENFIKACNDYFYLIDRKYPERGALKLTGDRYKLSGDERTVLYRGIASGGKSDERKKMLINKIDNKTLIIDAYNVLFTLLNYRNGKIVFISTDNILRDAGALHGKLKDERIFNECMVLLIKYLSHKDLNNVDLYFDSPVSHSGDHAKIAHHIMNENNVKGECLVVKSADPFLSNRTSGIIATSDTAIIEKARLPVYDLAREILENEYSASFIKLADYLKFET